VTTTEHPVTPATVAEWRRRKEADGGLPPDGHNGQLVNGHGAPPVNGHNSGPPVNGHGEQPRNGYDGPSVNGHGEQPRNGRGDQSVNGGGGQSVNGGGGQSANGHNGQSANGHGGQSGHGEHPRNGNGGPPPGEEAKIRNGFRVAAYAATALPRQTSPAGPSEPGQPVYADAREKDPAEERQPGFAELQQAGLTAILSIAEAGAPPRPRPVVTSPPTTSASTAPAIPGRRPAAATRASRGGAALAWKRLNTPRVILLCILAVQVILSLRLVWSNTAFMDEALYLWAGHMEIAHLLYGSAIPAFPTYFSGAPVIYPVLGAITDAYGGLALARLLSLAFMLASTALLYAATKRLFGHRAGLGAAAVFAVLGPVQMLGAFATFDAMSIFLLALSSWLVIRAEGRYSEFFLLAAALVMALANATKYTSVLWDPIIIALAMLTVTQSRLSRRVMRGARLTVYSLFALGGTLFWAGGHAYVQGILFTTLLRRAGGTPASMLTVAADSFNWVGIVFILGAIGIGISFTESFRTRLLCSTLVAAILLAPIEQGRIHILTSLHKHVAFGAWFAAVVAGYTLARAAEVHKAKGWRAIVVVAGIAAFLGIPQADASYRTWPDSSQMISDLAPVLASAHCPCLIAENNVVNYYLLRQTIAERFTGAFSFYYWDGPRRRVLHGYPAYEQAIVSHFFHVVEIDPDEDPGIYAPVTRALAEAPGWQLVGKESSGNPRKPFEIWRYNPTWSSSGARH
jgi:Dolichyl-phosphate-mannose-protein mannosyltransferase